MAEEAGYLGSFSPYKPISTTLFVDEEDMKIKLYLCVLLFVGCKARKDEKAKDGSESVTANRISQDGTDIGFNVRKGTATVDMAVGDLSRTDHIATGTTICARKTGSNSVVAAVLTAQHIGSQIGKTYNLYDAADRPHPLRVEKEIAVPMTNSTLDQFLVLRAVSTNETTDLPIKLIASKAGGVPDFGNYGVLGFGSKGDPGTAGELRYGTVNYFDTQAQGDLLKSKPGPLDQITCPGDSGGPMLSGSYIIGTDSHAEAPDPNNCNTVASALHMNTVKYRVFIESKALSLVPECNADSTLNCPFGYTNKALPTDAPDACKPGATMGEWRYMSASFPYMTPLAQGAFCRGEIDRTGAPTGQVVNGSHVGMTLAQPNGQSTPAPCSCFACGNVDVVVKPGQILDYAPGNACQPGCGLPEKEDVGYMYIEATNRQPQTIPPTIDKFLIMADFDATKRTSLRVACVPMHANCYVATRR